ncbi:hypothetical protein J4226_02895 [Candidatus Pacearchaeota archaeon]|nr:hypothetical protein [Candidatus Pacearchaeota archaeon]
MKSKLWLRETMRDIVALGGLPFFVLVLARVWMLDNVTYFSQFAIAGIFFGLVFFLLKQDWHAGMGLIALVFTSLYYEDVVFGVFGIAIYLALLASLIYLEKDWKKVGLGILVGGISVLVSFIYPYL